MSNYPSLRNLLVSIFSIQTGLDDKAARECYSRAIKSDLKAAAEIKAAFNDENTSWKELLYNKEYEVFEAESEQEAYEYAAKILNFSDLNK